MTQQDTQPPAETLAACPHCGGPAKFITPMGEWVGAGKGVNGGRYAADRARYVCAGLYEDSSRECASWRTYDTEREARAAWNDRPTSPAALTRRAGGDAIPAGMKPWHGGDAAPEDWDGGRVHYANGVTAQPLDDGDWQRPAEIPLIAYTPKPPAGGDEKDK